MFSKINYYPKNSFYNGTLNRYLQTGNSIFNAHEKEVQACLSEYISEDGIINGSDLKEHWFSISKKDIFISHSHKDINKVKAFAGWIYEVFGLEAFIDSCSWGYCDELLKKIDDKYCYNKKKGTYSYELRNYTTSHVHMMLSTALTEMIDNTECIIFFNTPNSINMSNELDKVKNHEKTVSPWIYHELSMTTLLRTNYPRRKKRILMSEYSLRESSLVIEYDVSNEIKELTTITDEVLTQWKEDWERTTKNDKEALDILYDIIYPKPFRN